MPSLVSNARAELQALTFPLRRRTKYRLNALANDALVGTGRPPRFEETLAEQWQRILGRSADVLEAMPAAGSPRVLFGTMLGGGLNRMVDATLAMALRLRGATVMVAGCNQSLPACEINPLGNYELEPGEFGAGGWRRGNLYTCNACRIKLDESHGVPGVERVDLSSFIRPEDIAKGKAAAEGVSIEALRGVTHRDVGVGEHAYSTLLKATLRGEPEDDARTRFMAQRFLASSVALVEAGERLLERTRPDHFVVPDGVYLSAGTLSELARRRGVHVVVHGTPFRKGTIWLYHGRSYFGALISERNQKWRSLEMTEERRRVADEYLKGKHFATRDYISYHVGSIQDEAAIREEVGLDQRPIVAVFTNVLWDAQLYYDFSLFPNMLVWLFETIRFYEKHPEVQLVLRLHPGEARGGSPTNQPLLPEIEREFPVLPENVKVVLPESRVSSYVLGAMSSAALIYGARVGVELVMLGTPVIVAGESLVRGRGFTYDPESREEYFALLGQGESLARPSAEDRELARKWYYHYVFRMMMPFPFFHPDPKGRGTSAGLSFSSLHDLLPGRSPVLDRACEGIVDPEAPFEWDEFE